MNQSELEEVRDVYIKYSGHRLYVDEAAVALNALQIVASKLFSHTAELGKLLVEARGEAEKLRNENAEPSPRMMLNSDQREEEIALYKWHNQLPWEKQ